LNPVPFELEAGEVGTRRRRLGSDKYRLSLQPSVTPFTVNINFLDVFAGRREEEKSGLMIEDRAVEQYVSQVKSAQEVNVF
jgi:hypothetical protein